MDTGFDEAIASNAPTFAAAKGWRTVLPGLLPTWLQRWLLLDLTKAEDKDLTDEMRIW